MQRIGNRSQRNSSHIRTSAKLALVAAACLSSLGFIVGAAATAGAASAPPSAVTGAVSDTKPNSVVVAGVVNPHGTQTDWYFEYGANTTFTADTAVHSAGAGAAGVAVSATISGLTAATAYDYRLVAKSSAGTTFGAVGSFNTSSGPVVSTGAATSITAHTASLVAAVNPEALTTNWYFEYGHTTGYGAKTAAKALVASPNASTVTAAISGLTSQSTYHFRVVAVNSAGTTVGADSTFTTGSAVTLNASAPSVTYGGTVTLSGVTTNATANEQVTIEGEQFNQTAFGGLGTVVTGAGGAWSYAVKPSVRTTYEAVVSGGTSSPVVVGVSPVVTLRGASVNHLVTSVRGAISFAGHVLQLQILYKGNWVTWKHVLLNSNAQASFATRLPKGVSQIRMAIAPFVPGIDQAAPGYLAGYSGTLNR